MLNNNKLIRAAHFGYSIRRFYVDEFYSRHIKMLKPDSVILDIGGTKLKKRGNFNVENYGFQVKYLNINPETAPDFLCDASSIPTEDNLFDGVICSEVLEHVEDPRPIMKEIFRVLKSEGAALVVVPFMYHVHADPYDFGRYTDYYWKQLAKDIGFREAQIEYQGTIYGVMANLIKLWAMEQLKIDRGHYFKNIALNFIVPRLVNFLMARDEKEAKNSSSWLYKANTTGFGMVFKK